MPRTIRVTARLVWDTLEPTVRVIRFRPAVGGRAPVLVTRLKAIRLTINGRRTGPTKRTTHRRKTVIIIRCRGHDETLRGDLVSILI